MVKMVKLFKFILTFAMVATLVMTSGCATTKHKKPRRYKQLHDGYPTKAPNISKIKDADPKIEAKSKIGNPKHYVVFKKRYHVLHSSQGYKERGLASFYGTKFQGHRTSNGEVYNMFDMSAAHKTLPLPTYVEVKNLDNGAKVIVRVNDRGPFHRGRIIDLSYAAAHKLGMLGRGTARVEVSAIDAKVWVAQKRGNHGYNNKETRIASRENTYNPPTKTKTSNNKSKQLNLAVQKIPRTAPPHTRTNAKSGKTLVASGKTLTLQIGAFSQKNNAVVLAEQTKQVLNHPVKIKEKITASNKKIFMVTIGPLAHNTNLAALKNTLVKAKLPSPIIVR